MSRRWYRLGGPPPGRWFTLRRVRLLGGGVALLLVGLVMAIQVQQVWTLLPVVAAGLLIGAALLGGGPTAELLVGLVSDLLRRPVARWGGWDSYDPSLDPCPFWLRGGGEVSVSAPAAAGALGLFDYRGGLAAVLEIEGGGDGIRPDAEHTLGEDAVVAVLKALARRAVPVAQLDVLTRAVPAGGAAHQQWVDARIRPGLPDGVLESMRLLTAEAERVAETIRTYVVVRMPVAALVAAVRERGDELDEASVPAEALRTVGVVSTLLTEHGIPVRRALSSAEKAALVRSVWVPSHDADDLVGIDEDSFWASWPRFDAERAATVATGAAGDRWWHAAASIPRTGYPEGPVVGRWLEPLVFAPEILWRLVVTRYRLLPQAEALTVARDQLNSAGARRVREEKTGEMSTGVVDDDMGVAQLLVEDVARRGHAGVAVTVRLVVSARSPQQLVRFCDEADRLLSQEMGGRELVWDDHRHTVGVLAALPLGLEVAA